MKPIHPLLVHFPIALLVFSVVADGLGYFLRLDSFASAGWWTMLATAASACVTVAAGLFDMRRAHHAGILSEEVHHRVHRHMYVGVALLVVILGLALWRWTLFDGNRTVPMLYLDAGAVTLALAVLQGWLGGELVYSDGVFVQVKATKGKEGDATSKQTQGPGHHH